MLGEKLLRRIEQKMQADGGSAGGVDSTENQQEDFVILEPPEVGQIWRTAGGAELSIVGRKEKSGRFVISAKDTKDDAAGERPIESEVLTAMLLSDGYRLVESLPPAMANGEMSVPGTSKETVIVPVREEEVSPTIGNEDEYVSLENETQEMIKKVEVINATIGKILEENVDAFGEKYDHFLDQLDTFVRLINELTEEDEKLNDIANEPGKQITSELLEKKKANHRELLALFAELENLELTLAVKAEAEKTGSLSDTEPVPPTASEEGVGSFQDLAASVSSSQITDINVYREKASSRLSENTLIDPPGAGNASVTTETDSRQPEEATATRTESVRSKRGRGIGTNEMKRRTEGERQTAKKNGGLFEAVSKALKEGEKFRKNGKPMLSIKTISPQGIDIEYRKDDADKEWIPMTIRPREIRDFSEYLKNTFGWTLGSEEKKVSKPAQKPGGKNIRQDAAPLDEDDAARESMSRESRPDYEDARSAKRIAAATKAGKGTDDIIRPGSEKMMSGERAEEEWTYEELENRLDPIEADALKGIVAKGLMIALNFSRENKMVKKDVIELLGGAEEVASSLSRAVTDALPSEWSEAEKKRFSSQLTKKRVEAFVAER